SSFRSSKVWPNESAENLAQTWIGSVNSPHSPSRNALLRIFPTFDFGKLVRKCTCLGTLYEVTCLRICAMRSSSVSAGSLRTTYSATTSPDLSSGTPIAALSNTPGWLEATSSTSFGYTLNPDTLIMSFLRSSRYTKPSSSMRPMSPVRSQPSGSITLAVSSGRFQYPSMTCGPRTQISPDALRPRSLPSSSRTVTSVEGTGRTTAPLNWRSFRRHTATTGEVSVSPQPWLNG